uniref:Uncharacterized protein n=1 Tax=Grammatophora oceanica TaxID=210454 RepID=A0A7S1UVX3_9STRA
MPNPISQVSLEGLSCRWTPIPSKYGAILSLLVYENPERSNSQTYSDVLQELDHILDFDRSNPAHMDRTKYRSFGQIWSEEKRFGVWHRGFGELIQFCLSIVIFRWGLMKTWLFDSDAAKATLRTHADYRKFDDMLRLVVDCTPDQAKAIEFVLQDRFNQGHLFYGIFSSTHAIMTCLVEGLGDGEHIHFMDGADGGYTLAGKALREQMESAAEARANRPFTNTGWSATPSSSDSGDKEYGIRLGDGPRSSNDDAVSDILGAADHDKSHSSSSTTPSSMGGLVKKFDSMKELETPVQFDPVQEYDEENQEELLVVEDTPDPTEEPFHDDDYEDDKEIGTSNKSHSSATSSSTTASSTGVAWVEKFDSMKEEQAPPAQFDPIQFDPNEEELVVDDTIIPTNSLHEFDEEDEEELGRSKKSSSKKKKSKKKKKKKSKDTAEQSEPDLELGNSRKSESSKESSRKKSKKAEKKKASKKASRHDEEETLRAQ